MSWWSLVSFGARLEASDENTTVPPSADSLASSVTESAWAPSLPTLTLARLWLTRSKRKKSLSLLVSFGTRLSALERTSRNRPSGVMSARKTPLSGSTSPVVKRTRSVAPVRTCLKNTSPWPLVPPGTRSVATDSLFESGSACRRHLTAAARDEPLGRQDEG